MAKRLPILFALVVFLLSLGVTGAVWQNARANLERALQIEFDFQARQTARQIARRLATYEQVMRDVRAHLLGNVVVDQSAFAEFIDGMRLAHTYPGIQGIAIAELVPADQLAAHQRAMQQQGFADYAIRPTGPRMLYSSITHIEPHTGKNARAIGFDMLTEPARRDAMQAARDSGEPTMSGKVTLVQESDARPHAGVVLYLPVYRRGAAIDTMAERRTALVGWVGAPFRMDDLMAALGSERFSDLMLDIHDADNGAASTLYRSSPAAQLGTSQFSQVQRLRVAGREWVLHIASAPAFERRLDRQQPILIALAGSATALLLAALVWLMASGRDRALTVARQMTMQLRESEFRWKYALEGAGDGVWDWDNRTNAVYHSQRWKRMLGYDEGEIEDSLQAWRRLIHPDDWAAAEQAQLAYLRDDTQAYVAQFQMRCKDGSWRWILSRAMAASRDQEGRLLRTIGTHADITAAKTTELALL